MIAFAVGVAVGLAAVLTLAALDAIAHSSAADEALAVLDVPDDETPIPVALEDRAGFAHHSCGCRSCSAHSGGVA